MTMLQAPLVPPDTLRAAAPAPHTDRCQPADSCLNIGLYGGSFNPVHYGHINTARFVQQELGLDRLLFLPNASPPHKNTVKLPFADRLEILQAALDECLDPEIFAISLLEQDESKPHYTYDSLTTLQEQFSKAAAISPVSGPTSDSAAAVAGTGGEPAATAAAARCACRLFFIMGWDSLMTLPAWKRGLELINLAELVVLRRPDCGTFEDLPDGVKASMQAAAQGQTPHRYHLLQNPDYDISSTAVRALIAAGKTLPDAMVPPQAAALIAARGYYRSIS